MNPAQPRSAALDGVRGLAILAVLVSHYFPERSPVGRSFHWGRFGVLLFFVLSGFLITRLLLQGRAAVERGETTTSEAFRVFVIRRALRIMPIYYLTVALAALAGYAPIVDNLFWHLTYTGNIAMAYFDAKLAQATHLWSLCVEEQFYLVWPIAVLLVARRGLVALTAALIASSFLFEAWGALSGRTWEQTHLVIQGCMDALGLGAWLALAWREGGAAAARLVNRFLWFGLPLFFFSQGFRWSVGIDGVDRLEYRLTSDIGMASMSLAVVFVATTRGALVRALEFGPLVALGRVSYGVYLYHLFLIAVGRWLSADHDWPALRPGATMFFVYSAISIAVATVSWRWIEKPLNDYKERFPYPPRAPR